MTIQELVNFLEKYPADAVVRISVLGYVARDVNSLELYMNNKEEDDNETFILELKDEACEW